MADKSFGVKEIELIGASGTPTIESPNNLEIKAVNVAISTDITVGGMVSLGAGTSISSPGTNVLTFGTNSTEKVRITSTGNLGLGTNNPTQKLEINNVTGGASLLIRTSPSISGGNLLFGDDASDTSGRVGYVHSSDYMFFSTNGGERLRITSVGDVLLGGLTTKNDGRNAKGITLKSPAGISFQNFGSNGSRNWRIRPDDLASWGSLEFSVSPTDNDNTDWPDAAGDVVLELKKNKDVKIHDGNLVIGTSGHGIDFSSESGSNSGSSSALLDDYEEGVYTPTFTCSSGSITLNGSYNIICYEKIGNVCHVHGRVRVSSVSSPSGALIIGLPFTRSNPGEDSARIGGSCVVQRASGAVSNYIIHPTGSTGVEIARGDGSNLIDTTVADNFSGDELVYISVTYRTA